MALTEQEEFEMLSLERERATASAAPLPTPALRSSAPSPTPFVPSGERPGFFSNMASVITAPQLAGGPIAMAGLEGMRQIDELMEKGAYSAGGAVTDIAARAGASPEVAGGAGFAANVGVRAIPSLIGGLAGQAAKPVLQATGRGFMQSALKPDAKSIVSGKAAQAVQAMLDEGANVSAGGAVKLRNAIDVLKRDIAGRVAVSGAKGTTIGKGESAREIVRQLEKFKAQATPSADKAALLKVWDEFNTAWANRIPIEKAQAIKQGTYRVLGDKAFQPTQQVADVAGQKAIARGLRVAIEKEIPEIAQLNAKEKALISALKLAEYRAAASGNMNPGGLAYMAENPAAATGFLLDRSPRFKSIMARLFHNVLGKNAPAIGAATGAVVGAKRE